MLMLPFWFTVVPAVTETLPEVELMLPFRVTLPVVAVTPMGPVVLVRL